MPKGKFDPKNVSKNMLGETKKDGSPKHCTHFWVSKGMTIKRNGKGDVSKITKQKCAMCGMADMKEEKYSDNRLMYEAKK